MLMKNIKVMGFEGAIRGMRNPMNSWYKGDSHFGYNEWGETIDIGENDFNLMKNLIKAGFYLKKTSMCSLLKKTMYFAHRSKVERFFLLPKKEKKRLS